jgi:hypothetical protein
LALQKAKLDRRRACGVIANRAELGQFQ